MSSQLLVRFDEADKLRYKEVEQARYERDLARRRYMSIDPENRLVADELESEWNLKLNDYKNAKEKYEKKRQEDLINLSQDKKEKIKGLFKNFPKLWSDDKTCSKDKKRVVRLIIEDVTLKKGTEIKIDIRFKGGRTESSSLPLARSAWLEKKHSPKVIAKIDALLNKHTDGEIAKILNDLGLTSGTGKRFDAQKISATRRNYNLKSYYTRLRAKGLKTIGEICQEHSVNRHKVYKWRDSGKLKGYRYDDVGRYLYEPIITR